MNKLFSFAILCFLSCLILNCSGPESPVFERLEDVEISGLSLGKGSTVSLKGDAVFQNPNVIGAKVVGISFDVFVNDKFLYTAKQEMDVDVDGDSEFKLPLSFDIPVEEVANNIKLTDLFKGHFLTYKLDGHIAVKLAGLEFKVPVVVEEKQKINL